MAFRHRRSGNRQTSIIGFTEAELGLFLALLFFGLTQMGKDKGQGGLGAQQRAVADTAAVRNPRLQQLMSLAEQLDSLERATRAAARRDSILAERIARLQRERDSLVNLGLAIGLRPGVPSSVTTLLTTVERDLARALLERQTTAPRVADGTRVLDSTRRRLDSIAPSLATALVPALTPVVRTVPIIEPRLTAALLALAGSRADTVAVQQALANTAPARDNTPTRAVETLGPLRPLDAATAVLEYTVARARGAFVPPPVNALESQRAEAELRDALLDVAVTRRDSVMVDRALAARGTLTESPTRAALRAVTDTAATRVAAQRLSADTTPRDGRVAAAMLALATTRADSLDVVRALAAQVAPGAPGSPGQPGSGVGTGVGMGTGISPLRTRGTVGAGIGAGSGTGAEGGSGVRSRQTPTCIELRVATGLIAEVQVLGATRYTVRGRTGPVDTVLAVLRPELDAARRNVCRHNIALRTADNLLAAEYVTALNALLPYFNTELAPARGGR